MFTTKPLGSSIKHLLKHPIALSPRESQKLLNSITSSFRRNLDREHGFETDEAAHSDAAAPASRSSSPSSAHHPSARRNTSTAATDEHIRSILANPLLNYQQHPDTAHHRPQYSHHDQLDFTPSTTKPHRSRSFSHGQPDAAIYTVKPLHRRSPVDIFDQAVARGMMTLRAATGCMIAVHSSCTAQDGSTNKLLAQSKMGSRVVDWLRASGQEQSLEFISSGEEGTAFVKMLMHFLLSEGFEGRIWDWIDRLISREVEAGEGHSDAGDKAKLLIDRLVVTKHAYSPATINGTIDDVARVDQKLSQNPGLGYILYPAWSYLAHLLTNSNAGLRLDVSATGFDKLLGLGGHINDLGASILSAHLRLRHPTDPTCEPAMDVLRGSSSVITKLLSRRIEGTDLPDGPTETAAMALARDTLAFLVDAGKDAEARNLSQFIGLDFESSLSRGAL